MNGQAFCAENVFQLIHELSVEIGSRFSGSPNCLKAGGLIEERFRELGLVVTEQKFDIPTGTQDETKLEILEREFGQLCCKPLYFSADTPPEGLIGELLYLESLEVLQRPGAAKGKILLLPARLLSPGPDLDMIFASRPLAIITISGDPGFKPRHDIAHENLFKPFDALPVFRISWEDGYRLVQSNARKARLVLRSTTLSGKGRNIIGELKGNRFPDEIVVICGHYDSPPDTPSATDNASGTAMMLEFARLYAQKGSRRTLRFVAMDAEERGYVGSRQYVQVLYDQHIQHTGGDQLLRRGEKSLLDQHLLAINLDVLGMALGQNACYVLGPGDLEASVRVLSKEMGINQQVITDSLYGSDHEPFAWAGIPGLNFSRIGPSMRYIHTADDTLQLINLDRLQETGILIDTFMGRYVAEAEQWPFERRIPPAQAEMIKEKFEKQLNWKLKNQTEKNSVP